MKTGNTRYAHNQCSFYQPFCGPVSTRMNKDELMNKDVYINQTVTNNYSV